MEKQNDGAYKTDFQRQMEAEFKEYKPQPVEEDTPFKFMAMLTRGDLRCALRSANTGEILRSEIAVQRSTAAITHVMKRLKEAQMVITNDQAKVLIEDSVTEYFGQLPAFRGVLVTVDREMQPQ